MYGNQFDGGAAFSGGGFMPSQATQYTVHPFSPAKSRDSQAVVPFTVKQINEDPLPSGDKSNFVVDGVEVSHVTVVGIVCNKVERVTDVGFVLDDGTGRIDVHKWINEAYDSKEMDSIADRMYVRVLANLKVFQDKRQLVVFAARPLTDFNELTFHYLECIYVHFYNTRLRAACLPAEAQMTSSVHGTPFRGYQGSQQNQGIDQLVMDFLQQPGNLLSNHGVHVDELVRRLNAPLDKIMESIKTLEDEGLVYSTIDDQHYKSAGNA